MSRVIVIGDIHGAFKALQHVVELVVPSPDDHFIFLGDYVDGWPESAQVVEYLLSFNQLYHCDFILGNHDVWCRNWLVNGKTNPTWLAHGGKEAIASYDGFSDASIEAHRQFFSSLKHHVVDSDNRLFIHAGYATDKGPAAEINGESYNWDRSLWTEALKAFANGADSRRPLPHRVQLYTEIYIGHTPTIRYGSYKPMQALNVYNIDTGAGFDGKLTAMDIRTGEIWQSHRVPVYYPGIKGRAG
ncbi:MAG: serine/threonine protein phosphatase [Chitinophagaceae bacterium]|nr:MAG: serine/threonine protein phosphatase [Chitinophagaceae bacterium]